MGLILTRYGEIGVKGKNKAWFIKILRRNIKECLTRQGIEAQVRKRGQRVYIETDRVGAALKALSYVFGVTSYSPVSEVEADIDIIKDEALRLSRAAVLNATKSFRIRAKRVTKDFYLTSPEIGRVVGGHVKSATDAEVDLSDAADVTVYIEMIRDKALLYTQKIEGAAGLPLATEGKVVALLSGGIDSPVAAWLMMKRGCEVVPLHFRQNKLEHSKFLDNCWILSRYACGSKIEPLVIAHEEVFGETYRRLQDIGAERWACIFCKRAFLQKASEVAEEVGASGIVTGDSLGQVASQTLENLELISYGIPKPILRPLIGLDKAEIVAMAKRIGSFDVSTRDSQVCQYLPPNPITRGDLSKFKVIMKTLSRRYERKHK